ncbi:MAG: hypothetical protein HY928_09475 [Elusimicrobia bacterium]|nr:hypothetical protein [Elusimicrobiota bacterium]
MSDRTFLAVVSLASGAVLCCVGFVLHRRFSEPFEPGGGFRPAGPPGRGLAAYAGAGLLVFGACFLLAGLTFLFV